VIILDGARRTTGETGAVSPTVRSDRWLAASLVWLVLFAWVASIYVLILAADGLGDTHSSTDWWAHVIAIALIAVTIEPVRRWVRLTVDDVVFGRPDDPYSVMTSLNRQIYTIGPTMGSAGTSPVGDPSLARTIARTLSLPYVSIVDGGTQTSTVGRRPAEHDLVDIPLAYQGSLIGHLWVAARRPGTRLSNRDLSLLTDLAHQLAVAIFAIRASEQVQASRAALVTAREEERRRIRRDLHDGLGPTLASIKLQLSVVQRLLEPDPARAADLLEEVREAMNQTTADVRRLVYGLRPPLIDELGLIAALRNHPSGHSRLDLAVYPDELPDLPAAIEVALYRIASEAIHNAGRHSGGRRCQVSIAVGADEVCMTVTDDGRGLPDPLVDGVGMSAMHERAAELGGVLTIGPADSGGTTVTTVVPMSSSLPS
jgi:two-component system NarL family sensor kinase